MKLYIQIDKDTNKVISYSSNKLNDDDLEFEEEELEVGFLNVPVFYMYNKDKNTFEHNKDLEKTLKEDHESTLTETQLMAQTQSQNELDIMILQQQVANLLDTVKTLQGGTK